MKFKYSIFSAIAALMLVFVASCGGNDQASDDNTGENKKVSAEKEKSETARMLEDLSSSNYEGKKSDSQASDVVAAYLTLKTALVQTNAKFAKAAAQELAKKIAKDEALSSLKSETEAIASTEDVEVQREHFSTLSDQFYEYLKENPVKDKKLYRQFCPMAFDNEGAHWISAEEEIKNPYFGDKMMKCGKVTDEL